VASALKLVDPKVVEPHEFQGTITSATPAYFLECSCGYNGLSRAADECPACIGRAEHHAKLTAVNLDQENPRGAADLAGMVDTAVARAVADVSEKFQAIIEKLQAQATGKPTPAQTLGGTR